MKLNYIEHIKEIAKVKGYTSKDLAKIAGLTEVGFHSSVKNKTLKVEQLIKIARELHIDLSSIFSAQIIDMPGSKEEKLERLMNKAKEIVKIRRNIYLEIAQTHEDYLNIALQIVKLKPEITLKEFMSQLGQEGNMGVKIDNDKYFI